MLETKERPPHVPQVKRGAGPPRRLSWGERWIRWLGIAGYTICGALATATPLMLWMTWSPEVYYLVLLVGFLACCGIVLLSKYLPEYREAERRRRGKP